MAGRELTFLRIGSFCSRVLPTVPLTVLVESATAGIGPRFLSGKTRLLQRHIQRVVTNNPQSDAVDPEREARRGLGSYGRYWVEFFRLPHLTNREIDRGFSFIGYEKIEDVRAMGYGPILILPHLGGWEWAAAWLGRISKVEVTAVVERLEPEEVFDWFSRLRQALGVNVVPLGSQAMVELSAAVKRRSIVCLLSDRDIGGNGVEVEFFGERTALPAGPAMLSRRTGAPLLPVAVFFRDRQRVCIVGDPIWPDEWNKKELSGRARTTAVTQVLATRLESLIEQAPEQWHLLEPNWPSDHA